MPTTKGFGEFVQNANVTVLGLVPSIVKVWKNTGCMEGVDFSKIKCFSSTGECSNAEDYLFLMSLAGYRPVIEYCGGTEIGGGYITGTLVQPQSPGTFSTPALGLDVKILDEEDNVAPEGELYIVPPSIGLSNTLLNRDHFEVYFKDTPKGPNGEILRRHGDQIKEISPWYYQGQGRADDTMNLGGIKTSSADIERVLNNIEGIVETAAIAVNPQDGGPSQLVVYAVVENKKDYLPKMQKAIKENLNPLFKISDLVFIESLPRTASNKVMRRVLRKDYEGQS
jgi:acetyl-CoA synthetase